MPGLDKVAWLTMAADAKCQTVLEHFGVSDSDLKPARHEHANGAVITIENSATRKTPPHSSFSR